jgi:hypothetical protein
MNEKQQQLTFDKGITNIPSDALCSDNALEESLGMVYDNGEHRPVQEPKKILTGVSGKILYIHKFDNQERYIVRKSGGIYWCLVSHTAGVVDTLTSGTKLFDETTDKTALQVTSIGKSLIITTTGATVFYIWKPNRYEEHQELPEIDIEFKLDDWESNSGIPADPVGNRAIWHNPDGIIRAEQYSSDTGRAYIITDQQNAYNDLIIGMYDDNIKHAHNECKFVRPFFVRAALLMMDGTYSKISDPILMTPNMLANSKISYKYNENYDSVIATFTYSCGLFFKLNNSFAAYKDLIKSVVIFVSDEIETLKRNVDLPIFGASTTGVNECVSIYGYPSLRFSEESDVSDRYYSNEGYVSFGYNNMPQKDISEVNRELEDVSLFYKIAEIGLNPNDDWKNVKDEMYGDILNTLETQEKLTSDNSSDYMAHSNISGKYAYVYNSRLNLSSVSRTLFDGFSYFMPYDNVNPVTGNAWQFSYRSYVTIRTDSSEEVIIKNEYSTSQKQGIWFYYPDSRATHVMIFKYIDNQWKCILDDDMEEHSGLNGAYYFRGLPVDADYEETEIPNVQEPTDISNGVAEELTNYILVSEVNNPFVFKAEGYVQVGVGNVKAMSTVTQAISQGQFGGFPLIAFSDNGIWALGVSNTGIISTASPKEREVISSPLSVTQSDDAVFFFSSRGLMAVIGSGNGIVIKCISEQLRGRNALEMDFIKFIQEAQIAYDYRDSLLWIGRPDSDILWLYSIKSGTFHRYSMGEDERAARRAAASNTIFNFINNYPDYLMQINEEVFSFMERPNINDDELSYAATITTRPMKLENAQALKSIMQVRHVLQFSPYDVTETHEDPETHQNVTTTTTNRGTLALHIYASNNLDNTPDSWVELHSLRGTPWKYYKFKFNFANMKATDRFAGTMLITQERRTNKLR